MSFGIILRVLKQKAVWWQVDHYDSFGKPIFKTAVEIKCRWEDINVLFTDKTGKEAVSKARVMVDRDMFMEDVLWQGELVDIATGSETLPYKNKRAYEIKGWSKIPTLKADKFVRTAFL